MSILLLLFVFMCGRLVWFNLRVGALQRVIRKVGGVINWLMWQKKKLKFFYRNLFSFLALFYLIFVYFKKKDSFWDLWLQQLLFKLIWNGASGTRWYFKRSRSKTFGPFGSLPSCCILCFLTENLSDKCRRPKSAMNNQVSYLSWVLVCTFWFSFLKVEKAPDFQSGDSSHFNRNSLI